MTPTVAKIKSDVARAGTWVLDRLVPPASVISGQPLASGRGITAEEWARLRHITAPCCAQCGLPFPYDMGVGAICLACTAEAPAFSSARAAVAYDEGSKPLILGFKHADRTEAAPLMAQMMMQVGSDLLTGVDAILPVPLHPLRLLSRRYNQAALLAQHVSRQTHTAYWPDTLRRVKTTGSQGQKTRQQRFDNVRGAFAIVPRAKQQVRGKTLLLVDDVMTTGATVSACARACLKAGATSVRVLTFARALKSEI